MMRRPLQQRHTLPLNVVRSFPNGSLHVVEFTHQSMNRMPKQHEQSSGMPIVKKGFDGEFDVGGKDEVDFPGGNEALGCGLEETVARAGVDVDVVAGVVVGAEDDDLVAVGDEAAVFARGGGEGLAEAFVYFLDLQSERVVVVVKTAMSTTKVHVSDKLDQYSQSLSNVPVVPPLLGMCQNKETSFPTLAVARNGLA